MSVVRLGLIGGNIAASKSPMLHRTAGSMCGLTITYELLIPAERGQSFDQVFDSCRDEGFRGVNVTYPFKEQAVGRVTLDNPDVEAVGACNTVIFEAPTPRGFNTDNSGFVAAFRENFGIAKPGHVAMAGAGGVGKATASALGRLGARSLAIYDSDAARAQALADRVRSHFPSMMLILAGSVEEAMDGADGLVNCTPLGMEGVPGSAFPDGKLRQGVWAFDAVYTPVETLFVQAARRAGLHVMTGYELFLHQGIDAFRIFTGQDIDSGALRRALKTQQEAAL
ncbi:shikimate dehydrogenase family protein [Lacibacterium aquatile]|uniref:Shikimate dehydrogenase family protein n=1 Tax=Lacibacterium aquatile TaxID=1168082 RepID=A0ABW5DLV2_9PROT